MKVHIVHLANFWSPTSGGIRTTLRALGRGYRAAGHRFTVVVPGRRSAVTIEDFGTLVEVASPSLPGSGYRVILRRAAVLALLEHLEPDRIEVSDRFTLRPVGVWARSRGVPSVYFNHERLDLLLQEWGVPKTLSDRWSVGHNRTTAAAFDTVVATTAFASAEFEHLGERVVRIPLGVDLPSTGRPERSPDCVRLLLCSRLSREKRPDLAVAAVEELGRRGQQVTLTVVGDGPLRSELQRQAAGLPVVFLGHLADRSRVVQEQAAADIALAPGPVETFGLAAVECLAAGTAVVVNSGSALAEVLGTDPAAGRAVPGEAPAIADAVQDLLRIPTQDRSAAARRRAADLSWDRTVGRMLALHGAA